MIFSFRISYQGVQILKRGQGREKGWRILGRPQGRHIYVHGVAQVREVPLVSGRSLRHLLCRRGRLREVGGPQLPPLLHRLLFEDPPESLEAFDNKLRGAELDAQLAGGFG